MTATPTAAAPASATPETTPGAPAPGHVAGIDLLTDGQPAADHLLLDLAARLGSLADGGTMATHWARLGERRHVSLSVELPEVGAAAGRLLLATLPCDPVRAVHCGEHRLGPLPLQALAATAAAAHTWRTSGRAVVFPGSANLVGTLTVRQVLDRSAIDRVRVLAAGEADLDARIVTREFVRPTWAGGKLVLVVQAAVGGTLRPYEVPDPTPCCAAHG